jgi:hypothetical protein
MRSIEIPQPNERGWRYRLFEILPGFLTYLILSLPVVLAIINPELAAYFIIAYLLLWFARAVALNIRSLQGYRLINQHQKAPWAELNKDLENLRAETPSAPQWHAKNLARVKANIGGERILPSQVYHAIIIAFYNESMDVLEPTVQSVIDSDYDLSKIILVLAYEERGGPGTEDVANKLISRYGKRFHYAEAVKHPADMPGEVIGKGGNITFAGRRLEQILKAKKLNPKHALVTTLDSDNRPHAQYLGALTYTYCSTEEPQHASYQPIPMFLNNIWDAPAPMRVIATGNSFWMVVQSLRPHILRNFSAHAQPMNALIDTDFWSVRTIVEDGHQYWRTWFRYDGKHDVFPIFIPIYQDAVLASTYRKTFKAQFIQIRRWAWGASDIAYFAHMAFWQKSKIPLPQRLSKFFRLLEGHISWSTAPLILLLAALVPFLVDPDNIISHQLPQLARWLQTIAMAGIFTTLFLSMRTLPPRPLRYKRHRNLWMILQWIYLPITTIAFSASAAIYSQTRLALGIYLGKFDVTEKAVKK